ncbi:DUF262 domain-containing HNH endonuclease family protein [Mesorhizobium sp. VK24D]|uniref:DUF262 domain-containing HNH endonuclease family protein n=1 Tax=Mesorhizobium album TaxID=3072314 RepID=A0ABU4Y1H2_9HYPH|nr:DUF262 domain-containing HNH endonuclease family protein [Mesorhizobium sp. VK24D]MDX8480782.1 DUF262 domain-containing HNH endonuclease family protein [Mesorhizobium sp. VK24D]
MRPFTRTIIELFDGKRRYLIPLYQRQYAWKVTPQLELLWEDIQRAAAKLEAESMLAAPHFMGAIVISQVKTFGKQVQAFEVIDGQQRLTTFQLLLTALRDVAVSHSPEYADEVAKYIFNDGVMEQTEVERFKLWPSLTDRASFIGVVDPEDKSDAATFRLDDEQGVVRPSVAAHAFFKDRIEKHVRPNGEYDAFRMEKLFEALRVGLAAVSIELEGGDDAQTIFETLNSRGVDLTASDLMRNFIFQRAKGLGQTKGSLNVDRLYQKFWLPLDGWFWKEGDTRGRQTKSRLDWLLVDHLTMKKAETVSVDDLFESYRRWVLDLTPFPSIEAELESIAASAAVHRRLSDQSADDPLGSFGRFAKAFDVSTAMPLVLYLASESGMDEGELSDALSLIESFIVRRDICGLTTANYNRFFVDMIAKLRADGQVSVDRVHQLLSASQADAIRFPTDSEWKAQWLGRDQYKGSRQPRLRYLFEALEHQKRTDRSEIIAIRSDLTLEHIMPQKWRENWPIPGFDHIPDGEVNPDQVARELERDSVINKLGNLTLLTHKLNAQVSNGAFSTKMPAVKAHTALALNRDLHQYDGWDEKTITHRGTALFDAACSIWPSPMIAEQNNQRAGADNAALTEQADAAE